MPTRAYNSLETALDVMKRSKMPGPWIIAGDAARGFAIYHASARHMVPAGLPIAATIPPDLDTQGA